MSFRAITAAFLLVATSVGAAHPQSLDPKADAVIERARTATATYTIYWRLRYVTGPGPADYAWASTFRHGPLVRVEDIGSRAVADCAAGTGTEFAVSIGQHDYRTGRKIAQLYCGIDSDRKVRSTRWLGQSQGKFGLVDEIEIVDEDGTFTYQVAPLGEVVGVQAVPRGGSPTAVGEPISIKYEVPQGDLFSRISLANAKTPKAIQSRASRAD